MKPIYENIRMTPVKSFGFFIVDLDQNLKEILQALWPMLEMLCLLGRKKPRSYTKILPVVHKNMKNIKAN